MMAGAEPGEPLGGAPFHAMHQLNDPATGLRGIIAIHSLARGPAFGGCRFQSYRSESDAIADACRLAEGMSYKNALAGLPFGGGKAVLMRTPHVLDRPELFRAFGRAIARLHGAYITAEDVGTTPADMKEVQSQTPYVSGVPRLGRFGGDPARFTALGVFLSIQSAAHLVLGRTSLEGVRVAVQGAGAVGSRLCGELARAGARLWVCDADAVKANAMRLAWDARVVNPESFLDQRVHVLAPCAMGGVFTGEAIARIQAPIIAGAANNQLGTTEDGDRLFERGICYLPDFLVNAGGIIAAAHEYLGTADELSVFADVAAISERVERLIREARRQDLPPARLALEWARAKLANRARSPGSLTR